MVNVLFYLPQSLDHQKSKFIIVFQITFFKKMEIKKKKKTFWRWKLESYTFSWHLLHLDWTIEMTEMKLESKKKNSSWAFWGPPSCGI